MTPFDIIWKLYDYKTGRKKAEARWDKLTSQQQDECLNHVPKYIKITFTDGTFPARKHFATYLNGECWNDEIQETQKPTYRVPVYKEVQLHEIASKKVANLHLKAIKNMLKKATPINHNPQYTLERRFNLFKKLEHICPDTTKQQLLTELKQFPDKYVDEIKYMEG